MRKLNVLVAMVVMACAVPSGYAASTGTVGFSPDPRNVLEGSGNFTVGLVGTSFSVTGATLGGGVNISFDPTILQVVSFIVDAATWNFSNTNGTIDNGAGTITGITFSSFPGVSGSSFNIGTLTLMPKTAATVGSSDLVLTLNSSTGGFVDDAGAFSVNFDNGLVNVQAVPAPGALWLLATGLAGLGIRRFRRA